MKNILRFVPLITLVGLFLTSCSPIKSYFFYSELKNTEEKFIQDEKGLFKQEGELFDIDYYFEGHNLTMGILLKNKTLDSVKINWNKSTLKVNDFSEKPISGVSRNGLNNISSPIMPQSEEKYEILKSAYFDMKAVNSKHLKTQNIYVADKKAKAINFSRELSPLTLTSTICITINGNDTIITNTFYISRICSINKKLYNMVKAESFDRKDGFYTSYEMDRGKENKLLNGVFEQLIKTSVNSVGTGELRNNPKQYDEDTFYVPNR
jgi:hypothetical protein